MTMWCVQLGFGYYGWGWPVHTRSLASAFMQQQEYEYRVGIPARIITLEQAERDYISLRMTCAP